MLTTIFNEILYRPIFNALVYLYNIIPGQDFGIAIIVLTLLVRFVLYPLSKKSIESQKAMQKFQPKIKELQEKYKDNKEKQAKVMMEFYRENKINPLSGCLPLLIQLPILFALYYAFMNGLKSNGFDILYPFIQDPGHINTMFLGIIDLSKRCVPLALLAGGLQYIQTKMIFIGKKEDEKNHKKKKSKDPQNPLQDMGSMMNKQMLYMMPMITVIFGITFPSGLVVYWVVTTLFAIGQQYLVLKKDKVQEQIEK